MCHIVKNMQVCCLIAVLLLLASVQIGTADTVFSEDTATALYDATVQVKPSAKISRTSSMRLLLEAGAGNAAVSVTLSEQFVTVESVSAAGTTRCGQVPSGVKRGEAYNLTVTRRGNWLGVLRDETLLFQGTVPRAAGAEASVVAGTGWEIVESSVQPLEPVAFSDNFMRTADEPGAWTATVGAWGLHSAWDNDPKGGGNKFHNIIYAQNPFAWVGRNPDGAAWCTAGEPYWDHYTFTAAVRPSANGAVGLAVNMRDSSQCLLARWSPANDRGPTGNRLILYRVNAGKRELLAQDMGGYLPNQWYKLAVTTTAAGVRVSVDGKERLHVPNVTPWRGGIGLYAEGSAGATFDDITAYGQSLKTDLIMEYQQARMNQRFAEDHKGIEEWAAPTTDWRWYPRQPGARMHRLDFFGDQWMTLTLQPRDFKYGELWLVLNSNGSDMATGYRAVVQRAPDTGKLTYTLFRDGQALSTKTGDALKLDEEYGFRFSHIGDRLRLEQDGEMVAEVKGVASVPGLRPAYRGDGFFSNAQDVTVLGRNTRDYAFSDAPTEWRGQGTWMATTRWACTPQWSFLGGWSHGDAVLWHKQRVSGDQYFEAYVATKMEYPRERQTYYSRFRDYGITICGDGHNPRSGYTGIYGAPDEMGNPNRRTVLLRNGVLVASTPLTCNGASGKGHTDWYGLALNKRGAVVEFLVEGRSTLTFTDPDPIDGGSPAIWTTDNGIAIGRARLHFANPPALRTDPLVIAEEPWYPEWGNLNRPMTVAFPNLWSTAGGQAKLAVEARKAPEGEPLPVVDTTRVVITPKSTGNYWYQVTARDGATDAAPVQIAFPVFNPALGRDDSRALVLYRFEEGSGDVVHDRGAVGPPADLVIPQGSTVQWLPGQGLAFHGVNRLLAEKNTAKLMGIAEKKACTIEFWISLDTIFSPSEWLGYLLAWEKPGNPQQNLAVIQARESLIMLPRNTILQPMNAWQPTAQQEMVNASGVRTGLQHFVITWDGTTTRCYINGQMMRQGPAAWNTAGWAPDAPLVLGGHLNPHQRRTQQFASFYQVADYVLAALPDSPNGILGNYYLTAIHDRCLPDAEVKRNYQAGPSAKWEP